jgi:hypothetical protein
MLVLSIGTTLNIGMLVMVPLPATWRLHLRWRLTLKFPPGVCAGPAAWPWSGCSSSWPPTSTA